MILCVEQTCGGGIEATGGSLERGARAEHGLAGAAGGGDDALADEIKAAEERAGAEMAGAAEVHEKLDERLAKFSKFAWEFVDAGLAVTVAFTAEETGAAFGKSEEDGLEGGGQAAGFLLGVDAGTCRTGEGQGCAEDLRSFFIVEGAGELFEIRDAIGAVEEDIDGEADSHVVGKFFKAGAKFAGLRNDFVEGGFADEFFAIDADDGGAGSSFCATENGEETARDQVLDEADPGSGFVEKRTAGFYKNGLAREPEIGGARRNDGAFLVDLACEEFGVEAALIHGAGFAGAGFS